jgi:hypothetical protein
VSGAGSALSAAAEDTTTAGSGFLAAGAAARFTGLRAS